MRRISRVTLAAMFALILSVGGRADNEIEATQAAANQLFGWFTELQGFAGQLVEAADMHKATQSFKDLRAQLFELEAEKGDLVDLLEAQELDRQAILKAVNDIDIRIRHVKSATKDAKLTLRDQYHLGGDKAEDALDSALSQRKAWIGRLQGSNIQRGSDEWKLLVSDGKAAVQGLKDASKALTVLIRAMNAQEG